MQTRLPLLALAVCLCLPSCGTVSELQPPTTGASVPTGKTFVRVLVKDFGHTVADDDGTTPVAARKFSDRIAEAIRAAKPGASVARDGKAGADTLVIEGEVTRFMEGNAALRFLVGMGAGCSYFDANVRLVDGGSSRVLGSIKVDKNSWGLGGGLAATQTVDVFMTQGAKKAADEAVQRLR